MPKKMSLWFCIATAVLAPGISFGFDDLYSEDLPTFITPANMLSSYRDTPNSVTTLEVEDLELLGIDNFVDAMRLVPGMIVAETHGSSAAIGYHGSNVQVPRRMQILYNSNRMYRAGYADPIWMRMPLELHDLERIEVVRGTSVADYGANAFGATVNMIQKPIGLESGFSGYVKSTSSNEKRALVSAAGDISNSKAYFRLSTVDSEGFDYSPQLESFDDAYNGTSLLYNGVLELNDRLLLDWYLAGSDYEYEFPAFDNLFSSETDIQATVGGFSGDGPTKEKTWSGAVKLSGAYSDDDMSSNWKAGLDATVFDREQNLHFCFPAFFYDPVLAQLDSADNIRLALSDTVLLIGSSLMFGVGMLNDSILSPLNPDQQALLVEFGQAVQAAGAGPVTSDLCSNTDQNLSENRYSAFFGYDLSTKRYSWSSNLMTKVEDVTSLTYLQGDHQRTSYEWSNNFRYRFTDSTILNAGIMAESNSDIDDVYYSPRLSLNHRFNDNHMVRILGAQSKRLPGIHETERRWQYDVAFTSGMQDYYGRQGGKTLRLSQSDNLLPEELDTVEIGYTFLTSFNSTVIDFKVFKEQYRNLISEPFSYIGFNLTNDGEAEIDGAEIGFQHKIALPMQMKFGGGVSYITNDSNTVQERTLYSMWSGNAWSIINLSENLDLGIAYFSSQNQASNSYDRLDINISYDFEVSRSVFGIDLNYRRYPKDQANYTEYSATDPFVLGYEDRDVISLRVQMEI